MKNDRNLLHHPALMLAAILGCGQVVWAQENDPPTQCSETARTHLWVSPRQPIADEPLRVVAVSTEGPLLELGLGKDDASMQWQSPQASGGIPWSLEAEIAPLPPGRYRLETKLKDGRSACRDFEVAETLDRRDGQNPPVSHWGLAEEALFSVWVEHLFDAPPEENLSFPSLEPVLRDPERNFLHNHLGRDEDIRLPATPDCADLPYFLRAYFAWKMGLPVGFRACSRGTAKAPPQCGPVKLHQEFSRGDASAGSFNALIREMADSVHSGSARTGLDDDATDFYPVPLSRETLWPGTVYADPYGHVLVLVRWVAPQNGRPGMLLAVDAQPDNSVSRKRFWEGTFLFASDLPGAGPGFKAFRPLLMNSGAPTLKNDSLVEGLDFPPYSLEQDQLPVEDFYARMGQLINPSGLAPEQAYEAMLDALVEQLETRVTSVQNGEAYFRQHPGAIIGMPAGAAVFETIGPWEDYSTPSRDMRLIIAMNVLQGLPDKILHYPQLFSLGGETPEDAKSRLRQYHLRRTAERQIEYQRSDGSSWRISLADALARKPAFEMAYNPNDCAEMRWGARPGTAEFLPCRRQAPAAQRTRMLEYRAWFRDARRPPR